MVGDMGEKLPLQALASRCVEGRDVQKSWFYQSQNLGGTEPEN
jgi:hypothetical protein